MSKRNKGILFIIIAAICFSLMSAFVRLAGDLPTMQKTLFRNLVAAIVAWGMLIWSRTKITVQRKDLPDLLMRSICGTLGLVCNFYAVDHMNVADANMLNKISPFVAILASALILKEEVTRFDWIAILIAFCGAILVIKPGVSIMSGIAIIGLLGGVVSGTAYTFVRKMGSRGVNGTIIIMFFSTFSTIVCFPFFVMQYQPMTLKQLIVLCCAGLFAAGGQIGITTAYTNAPAKEISVFDYSQIICAACWGFLFFGQIPDRWSILGYVIIIGAAIFRWAYTNGLIFQRKAD